MVTTDIRCQRIRLINCDILLNDVSYASTSMALVIPVSVVSIIRLCLRTDIAFGRTSRSVIGGSERPSCGLRFTQ